MTLPLLILSIGSIFFGYIFKDPLIGIGSNYLGNSIFINPFNTFNINDQFIDAEFIHPLIK
jgi:NADH-ubiquinone oxidoreductase chain 5